MDVNGGRCLPSLPSSFLISRRPFTPELKSLIQCSEAACVLAILPMSVEIPLNSHCETPNIVHD